MSFQKIRNLEEYSNLVDDWTKIKKELNQKVIENKLGEQSMLDTVSKQQAPTLELLKDIKGGVTKTVQTIEPSGERKTTVINLIDNITKYLDVTDPTSAPARTLQLLQDILNDQQAQNALLGAQPNQYQRIEALLERINKSVYFGSMNKNVITNSYQKVLDFAIGVNLDKGPIKIINKSIAKELLGDGFPKDLVDIIISTVTDKVLKSPKWDGQILDNENIVNELISDIQNALLIKKKDETDLTQNFKDLEKAIMSLSPGLGYSIIGSPTGVPVGVPVGVSRPPGGPFPPSSRGAPRGPPPPPPSGGPTPGVKKPLTDEQRIKKIFGENEPNEYVNSLSEDEKIFVKDYISELERKEGIDVKDKEDRAKIRILKAENIEKELLKKKKEADEADEASKKLEKVGSIAEEAAKAVLERKKKNASEGVITKENIDGNDYDVITFDNWKKKLISKSVGEPLYFVDNGGNLVNANIPLSPGVYVLLTTHVDDIKKESKPLKYDDLLDYRKISNIKVDGKSILDQMSPRNSKFYLINGPILPKNERDPDRNKTIDYLNNAIAVKLETRGIVEDLANAGFTKETFTDMIGTNIKQYQPIVDALPEEKKVGKGILSHRKRNPYKMDQSGNFGNVRIDPQQLLYYHKLKVYNKDNMLILDKKAPYDLIELLTKRYNPRKQYSDKSIKLFKTLVEMSSLPVSMMTGKFKMLNKKDGGCLCDGTPNKGDGIVKIFENPNKILERLGILVAERQAGNNSDMVRNEIMSILDVLLSKKMINKTEHKKIYDQYLK